MLPIGVSWKLKKRLCFVVLIVLVLSIILSGCDKVFADNPVLKDIKENENSDFDFSSFNPDDNNKISQETAPQDDSTEPTKLIPLENQKVFDDFIAQVKSSDTIGYYRNFSFADSQPQAISELEKLMFSEKIKVVEQKNDFVMDDEALKQRLIYKNGGGTVVSTENGSEKKVTLGKRERRHNLFYIASEAKIEFVSSNEEMVQGEKYLVFNVTENNQIAKWYFNSSGQLFLRMFLEDELLFAIKYQNLEMDFDASPEIFEVKGWEKSIELAEPPSSGVEPTQEKLPEAQTTTPEKPKATSPEATQANPAESTPATPKPNETTNTNPALGENLEPETTTTNDVTSETKEPPKTPPKPKIVEFSQKNSEIDGVKNYPYETLPLIYGYRVSNAQESINGERRNIQLQGTLGGTPAGAAAYYEDILSHNQMHYSSKEHYSEAEEATFYIIEGRLNGWDITVEVTENHSTLQGTMKIMLDR